MAKKEIKSSIKVAKKNVQNAILESDDKTDHDSKMKPPALSDNNRVVFSEEINRYSDMDDG